MRVYIQSIHGCQGIVKSFLHLSENNWWMLEEIVEVLQTLITTTLCLFQPFMLMGYYGVLWEYMVYSFRNIVFTELVALRPK